MATRVVFSETYNKRTLAQSGIALDFVQDSHSLSQRGGAALSGYGRRQQVTAADLRQDDLLLSAVGADTRCTRDMLGVAGLEEIAPERLDQRS